VLKWRNLMLSIYDDANNFLLKVQFRRAGEAQRWHPAHGHGMRRATSQNDGPPLPEV